MGNMGEVRTATAYPARTQTETAPRQAIGRVGEEEKVATPAGTARKAEAAVVTFKGSRENGFVAIDATGSVIAEKAPVMDGPVYVPEITPAPVGGGTSEQESVPEGPISTEFKAPADQVGDILPGAAKPMRVVSTAGGYAGKIDDLTQ